MRKISLIFMFCLLICGTVFGEDSVSKISNFVDPFGNQGSFWQVSYKGKPYKVLKLKSPERNGEADFAFDDVTLSDFEEHVAEMKRTPNTLKADGFKVLWSRQFGDASVRTILGRLNGVKVKMIQVEQTKSGEAKSEHQVCLDQCFGQFNSALTKAKKSK